MVIIDGIIHNKSIPRLLLCEDGSGCIFLLLLLARIESWLIVLARSDYTTTATSHNHQLDTYLYVQELGSPYHHR